MDRMTLVALVEAVASGECPPEVFVDEVVDAGVERAARDRLEFCLAAMWSVYRIFLNEVQAAEEEGGYDEDSCEEAEWRYNAWKRLEEARWRVECLLPAGA